MILRNAPLKPPEARDAPVQHVIEQYRHKAQLVTCVCGWQGSAASEMGAPSPWTKHVRESKTAGR